jgi:phosphate transport system protein
VRTGLVEMASLVLSQVEKGVAAWDAVDAIAAEEVIADDDAVDERLATLDAKIFELQTTDVDLADRRLLHVGLIAVVALERVGDLAVAIADQARAVRPEGAVPEVQALIGRMSARAIDALANAIQAIARGDVELGERAGQQAERVREMLGELLRVVAEAPDEPESRAWSAAAILVGRHLERVANNGKELGGRVRFMMTGERLGGARASSA